MKNSLKILFIFIFLSCNTVTHRQILKSPDKYDLYPDFSLIWDGKYPVNEFVATITLNKPIKGIDGNTIYILERYDMYNDSTFRLRLFLFDKN